MKKNNLNECANRVRAFMLLAEQEVNSRAKVPSSETLQLRYTLLEEELAELKEAMGFDGAEYDRTLVDVEKVYDAFIDIIYVALGGLVSFGLNFEDGFIEVCNSNDTKFREGYEIREDGKLIKSPLYEPPDLKKFIK